MTLPNSKALAGGCLGVGVAALGVAVTSGALRMPGLAIAFAALFVGGTAMSRANAIAQILAGYTNRTLRAAAWGKPLPAGSDELVTLESAFAISAGLHLRLRGVGSGRTYGMKVAQPTELVVHGIRLEIENARYVQWDGVKISRSGLGKALVLSVTE